MFKTEKNNWLAIGRTALCAVLILLGTAAVVQAQQDISGTWVFQNGTEMQRLILGSDGKFDYEVTSMSGQAHYNGTWQMSGNTVIFTPYQTNTPEQYPVQIHGQNSITITFYGRPVRFNRVGGAPMRGGGMPGGTQPGGGGQTGGGTVTGQDRTSELAGEWLFNGPAARMTFSFGQDRSYKLNINYTSGQTDNFSGTYQAQGGQLILNTDGGGKEVYPLTIHNQNSWTANFEGTPVTFVRTSSGGTQNSGGNSGGIAGAIGGGTKTTGPETENENEGGGPGALLRPRRPGDQGPGGTDDAGGQPTGNAVAPGLYYWESADGNDDVSLDIMPDGRFFMEVYVGDTEMDLQGTYRVTGNTITFTSNNGNSTGSLSGGNINLQVPNGPTVTLKLDAGGGDDYYETDDWNDDGGESGGNSSVAGTWIYNSPQGNIRAVLQPDGAYSLVVTDPNGATQNDYGTYTISGNTMTFSSQTDGSVSSAQYTLQGNTLTIKTPQWSMILQRAN